MTFFQFYVKKIIIILVILLLSVELYWYFTNNANLIIYIHNNISNKNPKISINIDGKTIYEDALTSNPIVSGGVSLKQQLGKHHLKIFNENEVEIFEDRFYLLFTTWLIVEVHQDDVELYYSYIPPSFQ